jgi:hypothetical protein
MASFGLGGQRQPGTFGPVAPFPLYTMPGAPGALEQQAMEAQKGMADFFGPLAQRDVSHVRRPVEAYHLPDAYAGTSEYLGSTLVYLMLNKNDFMMQEVLPYRFSLNQHISWSRVQFDRTLPEIQGEEAVPRLVTTEQSEDGASMLRRGIGFRVEHGFTGTAAGRRDYELKLAAIACACSEVIAQSSLLALLNAPSSYGRELIQAERATCLMDYFTNELFFFASMQKNEHAIFLLDKEVAGFFEKYGVQHDTYIVPPRMGMYAKIGDSGEVDYQKAGPAARANLTAEKGYTTIGGKKMFEAARYELDNSDRALDVMNRNREIGGVFTVRYWGAHREKDWHAQYSASKCTTEIYCAADDSIHSVNLAQCVEAAFNDRTKSNVQRAYQAMIDDMNGGHGGMHTTPTDGSATIGSHMLLAAHHWGKDVLTSYFKMLLKALELRPTDSAFPKLDDSILARVKARASRGIVGPDGNKMEAPGGPTFAYQQDSEGHIVPVFYPTWQSNHIDFTTVYKNVLMQQVAASCYHLSDVKAANFDGVEDVPYTWEQMKRAESVKGNRPGDYYAADSYFMADGELTQKFTDWLIGTRTKPSPFPTDLLNDDAQRDKVWFDCTGERDTPSKALVVAAMLSSYVTYCHVLYYIQKEKKTGTELLNDAEAIKGKLFEYFEIDDTMDTATGQPKAEPHLLPYGLMRAVMRNTSEANGSKDKRGFKIQQELGGEDGSALLKREIVASLNVIRRDLLYTALMTGQKMQMEDYIEKQRFHYAERMVMLIDDEPEPFNSDLLALKPLDLRNALNPKIETKDAAKLLCHNDNAPDEVLDQINTQTYDIMTSLTPMTELTKSTGLRGDLPYFPALRVPASAVPLGRMLPNPNVPHQYMFGAPDADMGDVSAIVSEVLSSLGVHLAGADVAKALQKLQLAAEAAGYKSTPGGKDYVELLARFFATPLAKNDLLALLHHDVPLPMAFLCTRPYRTYRCGSMIACQRGERLGFNFYGYPDFQVADDIISKTHTGHFTFQHAPAVINPQGTMTVPDVFITGYVGGENHRFIKDPDDLRNVGVENIITGAPRRGANNHAQSAPQSIFALPTLNPFIGDSLCPCSESGASNEIPCPMFLGNVPESGNGYEYRDDRFERFVHNEGAIPDALARAFNDTVWRLPTDSNDGTGGLEARTAMFTAPFINHVAHHNEFCWQETQWGYVDGKRKIIHDKGHMGSKMRRPGCGNVYRGFYQSIVRTEITEEVM